MSVKCGRCGCVFENAEDKKAHFVEDARAITYDLNLQEHVTELYVRCLNDREMFLYYDGNMKQGFHLKKGVQPRMKAERDFISIERLQDILLHFDLSASEVVKRLPEECTKGYRYNPTHVHKQKALEIARQLWRES